MGFDALMLSRVADAIYWMNRFVERAENVARFVQVNLNLALDAPSDGVEQWEPLVWITGDLPEFTSHYDRADRTSVIRFLAFDHDNPNSIVSCLASARENARTAREALSTEMWEHLNGFYLWVQRAQQDAGLEDVHGFFSRVRRDSHLFEGAMNATMTHGEGWHFGRLGRLLERADKTSRILDVKYFMLLPAPADVGTPIDALQWSALLRSASALEAYRKRHGRISPPQVVDFLVLDPEFPRSIRYCVQSAEDALRAVTQTMQGRFRHRVEQLLGRLRSTLDFLSVEEIVAQGLHEFLDDLQANLNKIDEAVFATFFELAPTATPAMVED